ncbi:MULTISPECIES: TMEM165/GDT1 family protein [unclassified Coleofasciculus]|uniref:TMEM165/GDT1 family protein n=1 Tax=unclassified Coleofasciculus TaxID=2692782 RepID=UPI0018807C66|nr:MULTISPECIES: TMEM165/GDT1 family protein [unclassified Coleofasciculus]MBE9125119.1 TMEM165/GDT1 family protein [Coleofasciculus sp. LEGE 07081]MBE9148336.1 TMEM165/GDT1 family protein [Coleofasciculus sp. LEGE 07092]
MLAAFTAGLLLITISELGDKTFFIGVILAMRYSRRLIFVGVMAALAAMTILSVLLGQVVGLLPQHYIHYGEIALFLGFGFKLLYDASQMPAQAENTGAKEAALEVAQQDRDGTVTLSKQKGWCSPNLAILLQAFAMTFLAEWGDRTQISTIALAATHPPIGVTAGAILGHGICTAIAVIGGRLIAGRISERLITALGGVLFLIFGAVAIFR